MNLRSLVLIRGLPGSGKSTLARKFWEMGYNHYEADMFFGQNYKFDKKLLGRAHTWCYDSTVKDLKTYCPVVVSNTFTTLNELKPYIKLRDSIPNLRIRIIEVSGDYKSIHDVPEKTIERMRRRFAKIPEDWDVEVIQYDN